MNLSSIGQQILRALSRARIPILTFALTYALSVFVGAVMVHLGIVFPYPVAAYRGWVGGIVSVNHDHSSRLTNPKEAIYYFFTLFLQVIPYSLAGGAGVNLGMAFFRPRPFYREDRWIGLPKEAVRDVVRIYLLVAPLFFADSLWEFLAR